MIDFEGKNGLEGENGLSESEFEAAQDKLKEKVKKAAAMELHKPQRFYFEFDNPEISHAAITLLNKLRDERKDYDETFMYFEGCGTDPKRQEGIEIRFSKGVIPDLRERIEKLLIDNGLVPLEEYKTVDGEPVPEETKIRKIIT